MGRKPKHSIPAKALPATDTASKAPRKLAGVVPASEDPSIAQRKPAWGLSLVDHGRHTLDRDDTTAWAAWPGDHAGFMKILNFLQAMERLTWQEIWALKTGGRRRGALHKSIPVDNIIAEAQGRLGQLELDDRDELFRFRLGNLERLWGVFVGGHHVFYPIWWDSDHKICPSKDP